MNLPCLSPLKYFKRASYVCESNNASILAQFKLGVAGLGNRQPILGRQRQSTCPLCPVPTTNCEQHLVAECSSVSMKRHETGISTFLTQCQLHGLPLPVAFRYYVTGLNFKGEPISKSSILDRGLALHDLRDEWLSRW